MSLKADLLYDLFANPAVYRDVKYRFFKRIDKDKIDDYKSKTRKEQTLTPGALSGTLSKLKREGLITNDGSVWRTTKKGEKLIDDGYYLRDFRPVVSRNSKKRIVVFYDIPENKRHKRDWIRDQLKNLNFKMIQKSVWMGPAPLPKDFVQYLSEINLLRYTKFLEGKEII